MQDGIAFITSLATFTPVPWEHLPDLGLYMDQVITYIQRQCRPLYTAQDNLITPAMINNYVKCGVVTRPVGKKYDRVQLAQLMMLCTLKQAASLEEIKKLLTPPEGMNVQQLYAAFCDMQANVFKTLAQKMSGASAMQCAIEAAAYRILNGERLAAQSSALINKEAYKDTPVPGKE